MLVFKAVLWALWGVGVLNIVALLVSMAACWLQERRGNKNLEMLPLAVAIFAVGTTSVGCLSGLVLILLSDAGAVLVVLIAGTVVQLVGPAVLVTALLSRLWAAWQTRRTLLHKEEVVRLIEAGIVSSFRRRFGMVKLSIHPGAVKEFPWRTRHARWEDYPAFVTAKERLVQRGNIPYVRKPR
ncbi:hypothetical protein [Amycolatopsis sp. lyj-109]|uniref:hypothetical protein n=1 Tax=Amycolatopsis sp. lyj-109 TaxID=2789287 RepID=UPI00397B79C9